MKNIFTISLLLFTSFILAQIEKKNLSFGEITLVTKAKIKFQNLTWKNDKAYYYNLESKKNDIFTMIAVGRLDPIKGFDKLIEQISKLDFDFVLNIIGEGSEKAKLEKLINSKNLEKKVFLLGFKDNIPQYLANSHLQIISSLTEGLPLTLLEGILNSSLIISTPVGGIVEVLDADYLLKIEEFSNKITDINKDYEKYCKDFKSKHEHLKQKFDFDDYSKSLVKYYEGCINAKTL